MALDLATVLGQAQQFTSQAAGWGNQLLDIANAQSKSAADDANIQTAIGANNQIIDGAQQSAAFATQQAKIKGANALGTNLKDQGQVLTGLSTSVLDLINQKNEADKVVGDKESVGLFDDPLTYLWNQITLPDDRAKAGAITQQLTTKEQQIQDLNNLTQATTVTQNQLSEPITAAGMAASQSNTALTAKLAADKAGREALSYNANGITQALTVSKDILGTQFQGLAAINSQQQIGIALQHLDLDRQRFDWQKQEKELADAARNKNTDVDNEAMTKINDGLTRMGMAPIPLGSPRAGNVLALLRSNSPAGELYSKAFQISRDSEMAGGGATILAPTAAGAVDLLDKLPNLKLSPAQQPVRALLANATQAIAQDPTLNRKDPQAVASALNGAAKTILSGMAQKIVPGDANNVFNVGNLGTLINASPEMQKLPVVSQIIAPAIAAGVDMSDPGKVFATVASGVQAGKISYADALELTSVYQRAVKVNLEARNLPSLGLNLTPTKPTDPSIYSYNAQVTTNRGFTGTQVVDFTKPDQLGRALNTFMANTVPNAIKRPDLTSPGSPPLKLFPGDISNSPTPGNTTDPNIYNTNPDYWKNFRAGKTAGNP